MKVVSFKVFQGRSIYAHKKCIRLNVDIEGYSEISSKKINKFNENLVSMLPNLAGHRCGIDEDGGFIKRLLEGTHLAHIAEHIILVLENMVGEEVSYGKAREISYDNYYIIYQYEHKSTGIEAGKLAVDIINSLIKGELFDINLRLNRLKEVLRDEKPVIGTLNICNEAKKLGIPILQIGEMGMFQLGYGKYSKIIQTTVGNETNAIGDMPKSIPLVAITGTNGKTTTTRLIGHILSNAGYTVGMTTTGGIYIGSECIVKGDTTGPNSALVVLTNKKVDAAVLETARGGIIRRGLAYDLADVGVITNITEDHLGMDEVQTLDELAKVKALIGEAVKENGYVIINGDDYMSVSIMNRIRCNFIIFSMDKNNEIMRSNLIKGGYGIYVDKNIVIIQKDTLREKLIEVDDIGITMNGALKYNIENAMAACGAAIGLGINHDTIRKSLMSFYCNQEQNPGRFNMYSVNNIKVVLDYGHNLQSYKRVLEGAKNIKHNKLIGIIGSPGDRLDSYMVEVGKCAGESFDYIFIKENEDRRGRAKGEVADILEKAILKTNFNILNIEKVLVDTEAFGIALNFAKPGDFIIAFVEYPEPFIDIMKNKLKKVEPSAIFS